MDQDSSINLNYEQPYLRAKVASYEREVANLKADNAELTESLYQAYARIKELTEELTSMRDGEIEVLDKLKYKTISGDERTWK